MDFPHPLQYFTRRCRDSGKAMARDAVEAPGGAVAPGPTGKSGEVTSG